ncbi:MAG: DnaJ domain-containing protein [Planctomycetota bacterium]
MNHDFINHYEILEVSANASFETIERVFRFLAKRFHPDSNEASEPEKFKTIVEAYQTLANPESRAKFDADLERNRLAERSIEEGAGSVDDDAADRHRLLSLFYAQRRRDMKYPGIGISTVEHLMNIPIEVLDFHIWYFREKGWIMREEGGTLSITADGVDHLENSALSKVESQLKRITDESNRLSDKSKPQKKSEPVAV